MLTHHWHLIVLSRIESTESLKYIHVYINAYIRTYIHTWFLYTDETCYKLCQQYILLVVGIGQKLIFCLGTLRARFLHVLKAPYVPSTPFQVVI